MSSNEMMKKGMKDLMKKGLGKKSTKPGSKVKELDLSMFENMPKPNMKAAGGMMKKKGYAKGGMMKKGYAKGGMMKKGYKKGGKVRGAGSCKKGVRPAKMVKMKGS